MRVLKLGEQTEVRIAETFKILVIVAALATLPLTAAYWFDWSHWAFTAVNWLIWSIFLLEYFFYMAISTQRWRTTRSMWLSVGIIILTFPLLHDLLKATRLLRLLRPLPLLRQGVLLRQVELAQLAAARAEGTKTGWGKAKEYFGEDHWITHWMVYLERLKAWVIDRVCDVFRRNTPREDS